MEDHCHSCQWLSEDVVVPTGWTTASDTAEAVATTVGAALVAAIFPSIAACLLDVPSEVTTVPRAECNSVSVRPPRN